MLLRFTAEHMQTRASKSAIPEKIQYSTKLYGPLGNSKAKKQDR